MKKVRFFSISRYVEAALTQAEYERDENGVVIATVPGASGFDNLEEARLNLRDVIEGNVLLALGSVDIGQITFEYVISSDTLCGSEKSLKRCLAGNPLGDFSSQAPRNDINSEMSTHPTAWPGDPGII